MNKIKKNLSTKKKYNNKPKPSLMFYIKNNCKWRNIQTSTTKILLRKGNIAPKIINCFLVLQKKSAKNIFALIFIKFLIKV